MHWSPERRRIELGGAALAVLVLGLAAERQRFAWSETRDWVPDLLVGWTFAGLGIAAALLRRPRGAAVLLAGSGVAWFFGNFYAVEPDWLGSLATHVSWVFLAPLIHLALAYPSGRPRTVVAGAGIAAGWIAVLLPSLDWGDPTARAALISAFAALALVELVRSPNHMRAQAGYGVVALVIVSLTTLASATIVSETGLLLAAVTLFVGLPASGVLAERALELDESTGTLRDALARLLGDPGLEIGYSINAAPPYLDDEGRAVATEVQGRITTEITGGARAVAIVVHDPAVIALEEDRQALSMAVVLAADRARLREDVRRRADEVTFSTRRLVRAGDAERARLAARVASGPGSRLAEAEKHIAEAREIDANTTELQAALDRSADQVSRAREELAAFASGLGVRALETGLAEAVRTLVDRVPLTVDADLEHIDCPPDTAATAWFVCAEAIANVLKHAEASSLHIAIQQTPAGVRVAVEDDGRGGADPEGSGLAGLRDRVRALGGRLHVAGRDDGGTRLVAELPLTHS